MKKPKRAIDELNSDALDAICTHGGILASVVDLVHDDEVMPFFQAELVRLQQVAAEEMERRRSVLLRSIGDELSGF